MMWLEIIEPSGNRIIRLEVPVDGKEWEHKIEHPVAIFPKIIRIVKDKLQEKEEKP